MNDKQFRKVSDIDQVALEAFATGDASSAVERQEKRAQESMVGGARLPKKLNSARGYHWEQICAAWGMTIGNEADELFNNVTLPEGWKIVATDHSMWTMLVDDKGRERANIFYKGAFYDRDAFMSLTKRYNWTMDYDSAKPNRIVQIIDRGQKPRETVVIHVVGQVERKSENDYSRETMDAEEALGQQADEWLSEHYPEYKSPFSYW